MEKSILPNWSEIHDIFGNAVTEYLKEHKCVIRKSKTGAFLMKPKDRHLFDDCSHLMRNLNHKKKNPQNQKICNKNPPPTIEYIDTDIKDNVYLFENFKQNRDFLQINKNFISELNEPTVSPNPSTPKENTEVNNDADLNITDREIHPKRKKINKIKSGIFKNLYKIVKCQHEECALKFKAVVECFIQNHRSFKYSIILDSIPQDETLVDGLLSKKQVLHFFHNVIYSVVPVSLFGNYANLKKIQNSVFFHLKASEKETFYIKHVLKSLNTNNVIWLKEIKDKQLKLSILHDIVQWFFEEFISGIVNTYLFTEKGVTDNQKYFFRRWRKKFYNKNYIKEQVEKNIFLPVESLDFISNNVPLAKLVFYTKKDGLRPILSTLASPEQKKERQMIKRILRQLYLKNYEIINTKKIHQIWSNLKKLHTSFEKTPLYFVSCDILDAYGSIIQSKLLKVINDKLDKLPSKLISKWFVILNTKNSPIIEEYSDSIAPDILPLTLPPRSLCCLDTKTEKLCKVIDVKQIKQKIESYIFKQLIYVSRKYYVLKQGVGQGLPMSALLCDLYYEDMLEKEFSDFMKHGHLFRYVDDFLYLTKSEDAANRFLEKVNAGIQSYNCTFKQRKTQSNLMPYNNEEFIYLGYRFNIKTFNVVPEYSSIPLRYTTTITRPLNNILNIFGQRISNFESLKLCPLILDCFINSEEAIFNTIEKASILSAERCLVILMNLFDLKDINYCEIFKIIKSRCVQVLISEFLRMMFINRENNLDLQNQIKNLVWRSFYKVFQSKKFVKRYFLRKIRNEYIIN